MVLFRAEIVGAMPMLEPRVVVVGTKEKELPKGPESGRDLASVGVRLSTVSVNIRVSNLRCFLASRSNPEMPSHSRWARPECVCENGLAL